MSNQIQIKIEGPKLTPEKFVIAAKEFLALVQGVGENISTEKIEWVVEVNAGSAIIRMRDTGPTTQSERCITAVCEGMRALRSGIASLPYGFTRDNVLSAKRLADLSDGQEISTISVQNGNASENIPQSVSAVADRILKGQSYDEFGSIEGRIDTLSARHGFICTIYDDIEKREITCYLQTDSAQRDALRGYTKRVMASGLIHYAAEGHPVSITVDEIRIFPPAEELPSSQDIQAIYELYK